MRRSKKAFATRSRRPMKAYATEGIIRKMYAAMCEDLSSNLSPLRDLAVARKRDPRCEIENMVPGSVPAWIYKRFVQLSSFHKRWLLESDKVPDKESLKDFIHSQSVFSLPPLCKRSAAVLAVAKDLVANILGPFDLDVFARHCAYGKKAALGLSARKSYLDNRVKRPSGTLEQVALYNEVRSRDPHLLRATRRYVNRTLIVDSIVVKTVPKTYKSSRIIAPDTTIGGFLSKGLGNYYRARLEESTHIDLSIQQERHRRYVQISSETGHLSTLDMSKASDSFTREHLRALLPKDWCVYTESLGYERCVVEDKTHPLVSVMLMGQGHTFPLQTLLFFALAEATRVLLKVRGKVSVYGDDIIVPTQMATQLITILTDLGFILNRDKSFFDAPDKIWRSKKFFRESCGADFYGGVDVRPFMPQGRSERLKAGRYTAFLHTMINGLYERWTDLEVPRTLELLYGELVRVNGFIAVVPDYETETAGVKHEPVLFTSFLVRPRVDTNTWLTTYCRLSLTTMKRRRGTDERIYYWRALWLGTRSDDIEYYEDDDSLSDTSFTLPENIRGLDPWYVFAR